MQNSGYLIVKKPSKVIERYEEIVIKREGYLDYYKKFRAAFSLFNPFQYQGISRCPLWGIPKKYRSEFNLIYEPRAQFFIWKLEKCGLCQDDMIISYKDMIKAFKKIKNKNAYDVIFMRTESFENNNNFLGFDLGYFGGDHFSLIADTIITPTWHGPPEEDYIELAERLKSLNENLLFSTAEEAEKFKRYYKSKTWAETESYEGQFCIIQVDKVSL